MFQVGQHVVFVNLNPEKLRRWSIRTGAIMPQVGVVYTVRKLYISSRGKRCLFLEEIINPQNPRGREYGYVVKSFRPLQKLTSEHFIQERENT